MTARLAFIAITTGLLAATAAAAAQEADPSADKAALLQSCAAHKFETVVSATVDGKPRGQKVKICGVAGQSDADWKKTLEDAVKKVETNAEMAASVRQQIVSALKLEIARLDAPAGRQQTAIGSATHIPDIRALPKPGQATAAPRRTPDPRPLEQDYANYKPLPPPLPAVTASASAGAAAVGPRLVGPRIRLLCSTQGDVRGTEECGDVYQNTVFTIRAEEAIAPGTSLRFLRKGDDRGDVELARMSAGQSVRIALPKRVCTGVNRSSLEIQVMRRPQGSGAPQPVDSHGPYYLRCSSSAF